MSDSILYVQMHQTLDALITNAQAMLLEVLNGPVQSGIFSLQEKQEHLLAELIEIDQKMQQDPSLNIEDLQEEFSVKMKKFKSLNQRFITHLNYCHNLVQFKERPKKCLKSLRRSRKSKTISQQ